MQTCRMNLFGIYHTRINSSVIISYHFSFPTKVMKATVHILRPSCWIGYYKLQTERIYFDILQEICQMGYFSKQLP